MREHKYRAWHRCPEGKWDEEADDWAYMMNYDLAFEEYAPINHLLSKVENLMQFTGLHDKNGKEIYEGDWFKSDDRVEPFRIIFFNGSFRGKYGLGEPTIDAPGFHFDGYEASRGAVIGNIYENPELLGDKPDA